jgi:hypothetical protein
VSFSVLLFAAAILALVSFAEHAGAAFPVSNGKIAFTTNRNQAGNEI